MTRGFLKRLARRYLVAGLLVWVPILATVLVLRFLLDLMERTLLVLPPQLRPDALLGMHVPFLGGVIAMLLALVVLVLTGVLVTNIIGRTLVAIWEDVLNHIPFVRAVYSGVKSFSTTILSNSGNSFKKVLLFEYPRAGMWSVGFQTAADVPVVSELTGEPVVCVFVPTTPNPTSGFIMMVPRSQVRELEMSVDAAMKMIVTLGVVAPPHTGTTGSHAVVPPLAAP